MIDILKNLFVSSYSHSRSPPYFLTALFTLLNPYPCRPCSLFVEISVLFFALGGVSQELDNSTVKIFPIEFMDKLIFLSLELWALSIALSRRLLKIDVRSLSAMNCN